MAKFLRRLISISGALKSLAVSNVEEKMEVVVVVVLVVVLVEVDDFKKVWCIASGEEKESMCGIQQSNKNREKMVVNRRSVMTMVMFFFASCNAVANLFAGL